MEVGVVVEVGMKVETEEEADTNRRLEVGVAMHVKV